MDWWHKLSRRNQRIHDPSGGQHCSKQRGTAMAATVIALPVLGLIIGGTVQLGLLFEAKATLNHAVLQAARAGMTNRAERETISTGLMRGLLPLYSPAADIASVRQKMTRVVFPDVVFNSCIRILNPTIPAVEEFRDGRGLPNPFLPQTSAAVGSSGVNVQDANLLKIYAEYGAPMIVPIVGPAIANALAASGQFDGFAQRQLQKNRLPMFASATVHMQSRAVANDFMVTPAELQSGDLCNNNLLRSFLNFNTLGQTAQKCLSDTGRTGVVTGGNCAACRDGIIPENGVTTCFACALDLGTVAECFNGNLVN